MISREGKPVTIKLYNTLSKQKEEFIPREKDKVSMYVCGPTTYNLIHLGNARPIIVFDMIRRYLEYRGFSVNFIQNFTDIDDKIINRAIEEKMDPLVLSKKYIDEFFKDAEALGVRKATMHPKVSEHIPEIIDMIKEIINKGHAYELNGDVYFDVRSYPNYGKLSGRDIDEMQAGARVGVDERKKDPMDFALWKTAKPGEPSWESPWGLGRPGWHIECSAMSLKYLGMGFDIHGGGFDLIFPHHENEIAQSEAYAGCSPFARYWMHNGFITVNEEKMSKSLGNFFTVREILRKYDSKVVRFYMLNTHYRSPLDFDDGKLEMSKKSLKRLENTIENLQNLLSSPLAKNAPVGNVSQQEEKLQQLIDLVEDNFVKAMDDDFNTALAIAQFFDLAKETNTIVNSSLQNSENLTTATIEVLKNTEKTFMTLGNVLGFFAAEKQESNDDTLAEGLMNLIIDIRQEARSKKDWATADRIRDGLKEIGIVLEDNPQGVRWKKI